ncbi:hypothetical protein FB45DRAFT_942857 [Roridomyces roridus]|uniref:Annexin n=1 Tax=Roridomyces roridus TaxID=1738132 RepID=A0AAD7F9B1_9AGAR|nr:hypothetical protein FB45DRAFT_942857 [Roridomyces roridus]
MSDPATSTPQGTAPYGAPPMPAPAFPSEYPAFPATSPTGGFAPPAGPPPQSSVYAPPAGPPPTQGSLYAPPPGFPPAPAGNYYNAYPAGAIEPPIVYYRGVAIHNPKFSGVIAKYDGADQDIASLLSLKGNGLIPALTKLGPLKTEVVVRDFPSHPNNKKCVSLKDHIKRETSGLVEDGLLGLILGPVRYDADRVRKALQGLGTNEEVLNEIVLELAPQDCSLLTYVYRETYGKTMLEDIKGDLSGSVAKLFETAVDVHRRMLPDANTPDHKQLAMDDARDLYKAGEGKMGTNEATFHTILTGRTPLHLVEVCRQYLDKQGKALSKAIQNEFSGDEKKSLESIIVGAELALSHPEFDPQALRDAKFLEDAMGSEGLLLMRILRAHWSRPRMDAITAAFPRVQEKHKGLALLSALDKIKKEKGALRDLLVGLVKGEGV